MFKRHHDPAERPRAGLYLRVSTTRQVDGNSLTTQRAQLRRHAVLQGYDVADIYVDAGCSGKDMKRPQLQRMLTDARAGNLDLVLVTRIDRISRSMKDLLDVLSMLGDNGVKFTAVEQPFDTSDPAGVLAQSILGSFAQFEREMLVERTREGHLHRLKSGDWSCGPVPYGYRKVDGRLVEEPEKADVVRRIFDLYLELQSARGVALRFNEEGIKSPGGKFWGSNAVLSVLRNPVYMGANVYGRHKKGDTRLRPREEWTVIPGMREPMVDSDVFERAQALVDQNRPKISAKRPPEEYPLSGKLKCPKCGAPMFGSTQRLRGKVYRYYKCSANQRGEGRRAWGYRCRRINRKRALGRR